MALINCPECSAQVSDKASNCPTCGITIFKPDEEVLHCPKCRSTKLYQGTRGASAAKAITGAALVGGVGLLAGSLGSSNLRLTCLSCNHKFKLNEAIKKVHGTNADKKRKDAWEEWTKWVISSAKSGKSVMEIQAKTHYRFPSLRTERITQTKIEELLKENGVEYKKSSLSDFIGCIILAIIVIIIILAFSI